jgi:hypothetical protein
MFGNRRALASRDRPRYFHGSCGRVSRRYPCSPRSPSGPALRKPPSFSSTPEAPVARAADPREVVEAAGNRARAGARTETRERPGTVAQETATPARTSVGKARSAATRAAAPGAAWVIVEKVPRAPTTRRVARRASASAHRAGTAARAGAMARVEAVEAPAARRAASRSALRTRSATTAFETTARRRSLRARTMTALVVSGEPRPARRIA